MAGRYCTLLSLVNTINLRTVLLHDPIAKLLPFASMDLLCLSDLAFVKTTVLDAPFSQLLPAVNCHSRISDHDLVEFVRE